MVSIFDPALGVKLLFALGITNIVSMLLVFFSCRCMAGVKFVDEMMQKHAWYRKYYSLHCYFWWIFFVSVLLHALLAFALFGNPF